MTETAPETYDPKVHTWSWVGESGSIPLAEWKLKHDSADTDTAAADAAAENGHLELLKWLSDRGFSATSYAIDYSSAHGHLEVVKFLDEHGVKPILAMKFASDNWKTEVVKYLYSRGYTGSDVTLK